MQDLLDVLREFDGELVLVLDDYHHIRSDSIHTALKFLVDYLPPNVHLFVLTRVELPFKISDWRVKDVCYEIATADMRCSDEEAREFMKLNAPFTVGAKEAEQLNRVTEGWITGLKLATLSIERTRSSARLLDRASGLSHLFSAYLMEEVLAHQAEETKEFLLKTSILSQLSPPLCDRVGPFENSQRILRTIEKENAFISPLDATHRWYRYHQIFQEFLYQRLESNCGDVIEGLHRRASEWFREEGMLELAIEHYLRGNMCGLAVSLIDEVSGAKWARGEVETLHAWLKALPVEEIEPYPDLLVLYADLLFSLGLREELARLLDEIDVERAAKRLSVEQANQLIGRLALVRGNLAQGSGDFVEIARSVREAEPLLRPDDLVWRSNLLMQKGWLYEARNQTALMEEAYWAAFIQRGNAEVFCDPTALTFLANRLFALGRLRGAIGVCQAALDSVFCNKLTQNLEGVHHLILGAALCHQGRLEAARSELQRGLERIDPVRDEVWHLDGLFFLIQVAIGLGQIENARELLQEYDTAFQQCSKRQVLTSHYRGLRIRIGLLLGDRRGAQEWSVLFNPESPMPIGYLYHDFNGPFLYTVGFDRLTLVRYLLWAKDYVQITRCLERWLQSFREGDRLAQLLEALVYLAIANYHLRRLDAAVNYLLEAFALAEPEAYLQLFRNETEDVLAYSTGGGPQHLESAGLGPEQSAVLLHFLEEVFPGEASSRALVVVPAHLLTARETEILG